MKTTQKTKVLEHLNKHHHITSLQAINLYGATRLSDIIFKLRKEGYDIITEQITTVNRYGNVTNYAKYVVNNSHLESKDS